MENEKLGIHFYAYSLVVIGIGILGMYLYTQLVNVLLVSIAIQVVATGYIYYHGKHNNLHEKYQQYLGFILPFIFVVMMIWVNTL